jgi:hypothetical protein
VVSDQVLELGVLQEVVGCPLARTQAVYDRASDGSEPVSDFIDEMDPRQQATLDLQIDRLNDQPPSAPRPPAP